MSGKELAGQSFDPASLPYRRCVGIMLINHDGLVWIGRRLVVDETHAGSWQMPQGGIDKGESAEDAAFRELWEETGVTRDNAQLVARASRELQYDLPEELIGKIWKGKWRGQRQWWFLMRFTGSDAQVDIETEHQEFGAWKWAEPGELPRLIVPFKRDLYRELLVEFAEHLSI